MNSRVLLFVLATFAPSTNTQPIQAIQVPIAAPMPKPRLLANVPIIWPIKGKINSGYGSRIDPFTGAESKHFGLDISGKIGAPIIAPADGKVVLAEKSGEYGNLVIIDHGNGITTRYGHLSAFNVKAGDEVIRGQSIGKVGSTGKSTGSHVHYELRVNNEPVNPTIFILDAITTEINKEDKQ